MKNTTLFIDPQSYNGLAKYDYYLLSNMTGDIIFVCSKLYNFKKLENIKSVPIFSYNKYTNTLAKTFSYMWSMLWLLVLLVKLKPACIHIQWFKIPTFDYYYFRLLKSCLHFRLVHTAHNVLPHDTGQRYFAIYNKLYHLSDEIIVHTQKTKEEMVQAFHLSETKLHVIKHGIMNFEYQEQDYVNLKISLENKYDLNNKFIFVSLGEQNHYKGFDLITKAWLSTPELKDNKNVLLVMAGVVKDQDASTISKCDNVILHDDYISEEEFVFWLRKADLYLFLYRQISQSGALLTAISEHVPILVSDIEGLTEPLKVSDVGWKIEDLSPENIAEAMKSIIAHPEKIQAIKDDNLAWAKLDDYYSWIPISRQTQEVYLR